MCAESTKKRISGATCKIIAWLERKGNQGVNPIGKQNPPARGIPLVYGYAPMEYCTDFK
jgi:hypothetical protein